MTEIADAVFRFRRVDDTELIAHVRRSAASWFGNQALCALEELIRRYEALEMDRKRNPVLVK
jgi:hypothetical protein